MNENQTETETTEPDTQAATEALLARVVEFRQKSDFFPMALQDANGEFPEDFELQWDMNLVLPFFMACYVDGWNAVVKKHGITLDQMNRFGQREGLREALRILHIALPEAPSHSQDELIQRVEHAIKARIKALQATPPVPPSPPPGT